MEEEEKGAKEISDAHASMEKAAKDKAEAEAKAKAEAEKAEAERKKAEDFKRRYKPDGLLHMDDGTRVDPLTGLVVGGVNNHAQIGSSSEPASKSMRQNSNRDTDGVPKDLSNGQSAMSMIEEQKK